MSCAILARLPPLLVVAALTAAEAWPARCDLDEAQCLIQGEVRVTRLGPDSSSGGVEPGGASPLSDRLRDRLDQISSTRKPTSGSSSHSRGDPFDIGSYGNYSAQWQKALALEANKRGDLAVLGLSFATNGVALLVCLIFVGVLRRIYPELYQNNARPIEEGGLATAPNVPENHFFGWATASLQVSQEQMRVCVGVDEMMLIEYANFCMRLMFVVGVPLVVILCPIHFFVGGGTVDKLSMIGMANIKQGSYVIWVHVVMIWYVVLVTEHLVHSAMHRFLDVRVRWLLELEPPRSTTVLVEGIPEAQRSDAELKAYFEMLFPNCIESVYLVKQTRRLSKLVQRAEVCRLRLEQAMFEWQNNGEDPTRRPTFYHPWVMRLFGGLVKQNDKLDYYKEQLQKLEADAEAERKYLLDASSEPMIETEDENGRMVKCLSERAKAVNAHAGFITFTSEREARLMLGMRCTASFEEWIPHVPPHHEDVIYEDLQVRLSAMKLFHIMGYACVVGVFFSFLPLICGVGTLASFEAFKRHFNFGESMAPEVGMIFEGVVASLALTTFTSFLPTILMLVFSTFFVLRAGAWAQLKLQTWLFWFNLIFVVLVTSLGGTLLGRLKDLVQTPLSALTFLADSLPHFTHFYLNYMLMQWVIHFLNLTRYIQLIKYFIWRAMVGPERAVVLTEPEDQDYYGIGSRSAQWTINLVIGIVFCTLCPLITIFAFINFFCTRVVYGYLVVFAETRKPDLGGPFFVTQLWHTQYGLLVYAVLMVGVVWHRSQNNIIMLVAVAPTIAYVLFGFYYFYTNYQWEAMPFEQLCTDEAKEDFAAQIDAYRALGKDRPCYLQEELMRREEQPASPKLEHLQRQGLKASRTKMSRLDLGVTHTSSAEGSGSVGRSTRNVGREAMVGGNTITSTTREVGTAAGTAASGVNARAHVVIDAGLDFVNRHFAEWRPEDEERERGGGAGGRREAARSRRRPTLRRVRTTGSDGAVVRPGSRAQEMGEAGSPGGRSPTMSRAHTDGDLESTASHEPSQDASWGPRRLSAVREGSADDESSSDDAVEAYDSEQPREAPEQDPQSAEFGRRKTG